MIHAVAGAASGAINSAITGGNVGMGAATSALAAGIAEGIDAGFGSYLPKDFFSRFAVRTLVGGVTGGISAEIMGGDFGKGFAQGAQTAAIAFLANHVLHETLDKLIKFNGMYNQAQSDSPQLAWNPLHPGKLIGKILGYQLGKTLDPGEIMGDLEEKALLNDERQRRLDEHIRSIQPIRVYSPNAVPARPGVYPPNEVPARP